MSSPFHATDAERARAEFEVLLHSHHWDYFATFTSEHKLSLYSARKIMSQYYEVLKKYHGRLFWIAEEFTSKDGFHIHALIATPKQATHIMVLGNQYFINIWNNLTSGHFGGTATRCKVEKFDPIRAAGYYLTKDMLKEKVDYDFQWKIVLTKTKHNDKANFN